MGVTAIVVSGCTSSREVAYTGHPRNSRFINDITLKGNSTNVNTKVAGHKYSRTERIEKKAEKAERNTYSNYTAPLNKCIVIDMPGRPYDAQPLQTKYAAVLGIMPFSISNLSLYSFIDDWYGVRYRMGGNDKSGIDCSAFVQRLYESVFCTNLVRTAFEQFNLCQLIWNTDSLKEGDLVFFGHSTGRHGRRRGHSVISHVGIYLANNYFVHASTTGGVMISSLKEEYWSRYYAGAGAIPKS